jgi:hypothetical protein
MRQSFGFATKCFLRTKTFANLQIHNACTVLGGEAGANFLGSWTAIQYGRHTDKKENQIFPIYEEILNGAVGKSYMTNGLLIYGEIFAHFLIY